jgi:hypothetical protein
LDIEATKAHIHQDKLTLDETDSVILSPVFFKMEKIFEIKGGLVVALLLLLTGIVGTLFIVLGPQATEKSPGVIHIGVRYANERSLEFNQYGKNGPGATIEIVALDGTIAYTHQKLQIGRNLMPLKNSANGNYIARLSAPGYKTREVPIIVEGRMINPPKDAKLEDGSIVDYNMIGVRFDLGS